MIVIIKFLTRHNIVGFRMVSEEMVSFVMNLVPYLSTGVLALNINLGLERLGFKITKRDYRRKPMPSLVLGLCLIFIGSLISVAIQSELSGFEPFVAFALLLVVFLGLAAT